MVKLLSVTGHGSITGSKGEERRENETKESFASKSRIFESRMVPMAE